MDKRYTIKGLEIAVSFRDGLVGIDNNKALWILIDRHGADEVRTLIDLVYAEHLLLYGRALAIVPRSFLLEIWGHVYAEYLLLRYHRFFRFILPSRWYDSLIESCDILDCGEKGRDPNRWFWDIMSWFNPIHRMLFPRKIIGKGVKER